jgi:ATP-dependent Clp protease ATP-binding subunit ClpA
VFERFTGSARIAVQLAQEYGRQHHAATIRTEHLLIGVLGAPEGSAVELLAERGVRREDVAADVAALRNAEEPDPEALRTLGIDLNEVRRRTEEAFGPGALERGWAGRGRGARRLGGHIPFEAASKKALELSLREAIALKHREIRVEHLLLGLLRTGEGAAHRILAARGVTLAEIRAAVADPHRGSAAG